MSMTMVLFILITSSTVIATQGSPDFINIDYTSGISTKLIQNSKMGENEAIKEAVKTVAGSFSTIQNAKGNTLFPAGMACVSVEIVDGMMTVNMSLPNDFKKGSISEIDIETACEILRLNFAEPEILKGIEILASADSSKGKYQPLADFTIPLPKIDTNDNWYEPDGPGPQPAPDYKALKNNKNVSGQGPLGTSGQPSGALSGRTIYFSGGHGWTWTGSGWGLQRPRLLQMNEDHGNLDQINFFAHYLFNAGATVVSMRPLGYQENEVVMDNTSAGVSWNGTWYDSSNSRYYGPGSPPYRYADASSSETATATYVPNIPEAGFYPVYCWANYGSDRTPDQLYKVYHTGGIAEIRVNHRQVGCGWVWLGNYYFEAGSNQSTGSVVISNQSSDPTSHIVIADAIRFGNGEGDIDRGGGISGYLKETECSRYWVQSGIGEGGSSTVYDVSGLDDGDDNVGTPPRMAAQMRRDDGQGYYHDIYLGFHTNAGGARGVVGLITTLTPSTNGEDFAQYVGEEVNDDCVYEDGLGNWPATWYDRTSVTYTGAYGEFSGSNLNYEMCGSLVEVAFHDDEDDALMLREPKVRAVAARACYQAIVRFFNEFDGLTLTFLPEPPVRFNAVNNGSGGVTLSWAAGPSGGAGGDAATGYVVYRSTNGLSYGSPVTTTGTSTTINGLTPGQTYYFRVAATNAGGESMPSEVLSVRVKSSGTSPVLIVNGYDRIDRYNNRTEDRPVMTDVDRLYLRHNNSYDYVIQYASAIDNHGADFDSCSNEAVENGDISLSSYDAVFWICGEESTFDDTFSTTEQGLVQTYLTSGGQLFVSGAEIGYELDYLSYGQSFFNNYLKADYYDDDADTYTAQGSAGIFAGLGTITFDDGTYFYDVDWPDQLSGAT